MKQQLKWLGAVAVFAALQSCNLQNSNQKAVQEPLLLMVPEQAKDVWIKHNPAYFQWTTLLMLAQMTEHP